MEVRETLSKNDIFVTKYASVCASDDGSVTMITLTMPHKTRSRDDMASLKDVEFSILNGVLYVKGTRIFYHKLETILTCVTLWGKRNVWQVHNHTKNDNLAEPFKETDVVVPKWIFFKKTIKGIDLDAPGVPELQEWYLSKEETPYEIACSNFKLRELI